MRKPCAHGVLQLIHASRDTHVWAESQPELSAKRFRYLRSLSQTIAKEIKTAISPVNLSTKKSRTPTMPTYADIILSQIAICNGARNISRKRSRCGHPDYAAAWSGLADSYSAGGGWHLFSFNCNGESRRQKPKQSNSMILFPMPIRLARFCICLIRGEWQHAEAEILRAIELEPETQSSPPLLLRTYYL